MIKTTNIWGFTKHWNYRTFFLFFIIIDRTWYRAKLSYKYDNYRTSGNTIESSAQKGRGYIEELAQCRNIYLNYLVTLYFKMTVTL